MQIVNAMNIEYAIKTGCNWDIPFIFIANNYAKSGIQCMLHITVMYELKVLISQKYNNIII